MNRARGKCLKERHKHLPGGEASQFTGMHLERTCFLPSFGPSRIGCFRGVYLATVFYHKENILVTAEDQIPLVEIQCCSTSITQDFLWFAKVHRHIHV